MHTLWQLRHWWTLMTNDFLAGLLGGALSIHKIDIERQHMMNRGMYVGPLGGCGRLQNTLYVPLQPTTSEQRMREKLEKAKRWLTQESPRWKR